jgi:hypothetical protein
MVRKKYSLYRSLLCAQIQFMDTGYIWIPSLVFETAICFFTVIKTYQKAIKEQAMGSRILVVLFRDGLLYYVVCIVFLVPTVKTNALHRSLLVRKMLIGRGYGNFHSNCDPF